LSSFSSSSSSSSSSCSSSTSTSNYVASDRPRCRRLLQTERNELEELLRQSLSCACTQAHSAFQVGSVKIDQCNNDNDDDRHWNRRYDSTITITILCTSASLLDRFERQNDDKCYDHDDYDTLRVGTGGWLRGMTNSTRIGCRSAYGGSPYT
jgi:hypothetical protein